MPQVKPQEHTPEVHTRPPLRVDPPPPQPRVLEYDHHPKYFVHTHGKEEHGKQPCQGVEDRSVAIFMGWPKKILTQD